PETDIAFPESVVSFFAGELGQPAGGFPPALQRKVLGDKEPMTERPGDLLPPLDLAAEREEAERRAERRLSDAEFAGYLMYPDVFLDFVGQLRRYGDLTVLPTTVFFYGMEPGDEITAEIENGKLLIVRYIATSEVHDESGERTVFFELNGQPRAVRVADAARQMDIVQREKVDPNNDRQVGAAMPGLVATLAVAPGDKVQRGDVLLTLEAMKMQTSVRSDIDGEIAEVNVAVGQQVESKDLLLSYR
ncbi:MAG: biotin/lipoyl-binding protein, partial [Gammaproteobacteria bacterium]|nr:biotin/lipoyl-binding protein [Gammaproteobacteria bacterium]